MNTIRDEIACMKPERAARVREDYVSQREFQRKRLIQLKARKARLLKKLDEEIASTTEDIQNITSVIDEIDRAHFDTLQDLKEVDFDECF